MAEQALEKERSGQKNRKNAPGEMDFSLPGRKPLQGGMHLLTQVNEEIVSIFERLGFEVSEGPEVELDYYNFEALNFPKDHPAGTCKIPSISLRMCLAYQPLRFKYAPWKAETSSPGHRTGKGLPA